MCLGKIEEGRRRKEMEWVQIVRMKKRDGLGTISAGVDPVCTSLNKSVSVLK